MGGMFPPPGKKPSDDDASLFMEPEQIAPVFYFHKKGKYGKRKNWTSGSWSSWWSVYYFFPNLSEANIERAALS
jgi:hypothetical protein